MVLGVFKKSSSVMVFSSGVAFTASMSLAAPLYYPSHDEPARSSTSSISQPLTKPTHHQFDTAATMVGSSSDIVISSERASKESDWAGEALRAPAWVTAFRRLDEAASFDDGWDGPGSLRADRGALMGARDLLTNLETLIPAEAAPRVGLDYDGTPTLSWLQSGLVGSLSVFDDDSYGYYIERGELSDSVEEARLSQAFPESLLGILCA